MTALIGELPRACCGRSMPRKAAAIAAAPTIQRRFGWAHLPSDSGLTEAQEDVIDYWNPSG